MLAQIYLKYFIQLLDAFLINLCLVATYPVVCKQNINNLLVGSFFAMMIIVFLVQQLTASESQNGCIDT